MRPSYDRVFTLITDLESVSIVKESCSALQEVAIP